MKTKRRRIKLGAASSPETKKEQTYNSMIRYIQRHPKYSVMLKALREGIPIPEVARWFVEHDWVDITEKTFSEYLRTFKRRFPDMISGGDDNFIDSIVDAHQPNLDVITELNRILRIQKLRLKIDVANEQNIGKLFNTTHKEMLVYKELLETIAKVEGKIQTGGMKETEGVPGDVRDNLRNIRKDEIQRDRMSSLTSELTRVLNAT